MNLAVLDLATAPPQTRETLADVKKKYGFLPNLYGIFAHSPAPLAAYLGISAAFDQSSFTPLERNIVLLTTSRANDCRYCVAVHSAVGDMQKHPADVIDAIRNDTPIPGIGGTTAASEAARRCSVSGVRTRRNRAPASEKQCVGRFARVAHDDPSLHPAEPTLRGELACQNPQATCGGPRALPSGNGVDRRPRWSRIAVTALSFSMNASTTRRPPQRAHFSTSTPKTRLSAAAQSRR